MAVDPAQSSTQYFLWAGVDPRPGLGYCVIAREVIPAGSFVFEYAGEYLTVSLFGGRLRLPDLAEQMCTQDFVCMYPSTQPHTHSFVLLVPQHRVQQLSVAYVALMSGLLWMQSAQSKAHSQQCNDARFADQLQRHRCDMLLSADIIIIIKMHV